MFPASSLPVQQHRVGVLASSLCTPLCESGRQCWGSVHSRNKWQNEILWEWEYSAKIVTQSEPLSLGAMATYRKGGQTVVSLRTDVFGCNKQVEAMAFSISALRSNCKAVPSSPLLLAPHAFQFPPAELPLTSAWYKLVAFSVCFSAFQSVCVGKKYTCCLPEHLLCPALFSLVRFRPLLDHE